MHLESAQNHAKSDLLHSREFNRIRAVFICSGGRQHRASHWTLLRVNGSLCARFTSPFCFATTVSFLEAPCLVHVAKKLLPPPVKPQTRSRQIFFSSESLYHHGCRRLAPSGLEEDMRCEQRNFGSRANIPKASRVSKERPIAITNSLAKKVSRPAASKVA